MEAMTMTAVDTRTPYRTCPTAAHVPRTPTAAGGNPSDMVAFRPLVRNLIRAPHRDRDRARAAVVAQLNASRDPGPALTELLFECADRGGPDGLDLATDIIAQVGPAATVYARLLLSVDGPRWQPADLRRRVSDNVWYALLRGVCRSSADPVSKLAVIVPAMFKGTVSIREAAAHAAGDFADRDSDFRDVADIMLKHVRTEDESADVRRTAAEVLADMES